jgi:peptidyl-prolyl cis-trans isomerase D
MSEEEALEAAAAARQRLMAGEDFGDLALELSSDVVSAEEGGDIGYSDGTLFPEPIEEALMSMALDEISEPVVTDFGVHLVKLTEAQTNVYPELAEVRERIERELKSSEVDLIYGERLSDLSNLAFESGDLSIIAERLGLPILEGAPFSQSGGNGVFSNPDVVDAAFSFEVYSEGNNSEVIELNDSQAMVLRVVDINEASVEPLDEVRGEISVILRTEMEREAVADLGTELLEAAESGSGLDEMLEANGLEWVDASGSGRNGTGVNRQILNEAFAMGRPAEGESEFGSVLLANGTFALIELQSVNEGSVESLEEVQRETMVENMLTDLGNSDLQALIGSLRENSDIRTSEPVEEFQ